MLHESLGLPVVEIGLLVAVVVAVAVVYYLLKKLKALVVNAIVGLLVIGIASVVGIGVEVTPIVILIVAFGGLPAAVVILLLSNFGVMFAPAVLPGLIGLL